MDDSLDASLTTPPQANGGGSHHELGSKKQKPSKGETLSKNVCKLIIGGNKFDEDVTIEDFFTHKVIVDLNMLSASMVHRIGSQG